MFWVIFHIFLLGMLYIDLFFFPKRQLGTKGALFCSFFWIVIALGFNGLILLIFGKEDALSFLTAYIVEKSLSIDNLFLFYTIFTSLAIPVDRQHKILLFGICGALALRLACILLGISLVTTFPWMYVILGLFLAASAVFMYRKEKREESHLFSVPNWMRRFLCEQEQTNRFFIRINNKRFYTINFLALLLIEFFDLIFAIDSVPAVIAITKNPFLAYTSNAFAVLGLRSLYFLLAGYAESFAHVRKGIIWILAFIAVKLVISPIYEIPNGICLLFISVVLGICSLLSLKRK